MLRSVRANASIRGLPDSAIRDSDRSDQSDSSDHSVMASGSERGNRNLFVQESVNQTYEQVVWRSWCNYRAIYCMSHLRRILPLDNVWSRGSHRVRTDPIFCTSHIHRCGTAHASAHANYDCSKNAEGVGDFLHTSWQHRSGTSSVVSRLSSSILHRGKSRGSLIRLARRQTVVERDVT